MKKVLMILIVLLAVVSMGAFAQITDTATLFLSGTVGNYVSITVTPNASATSLALAAGQSSPLQVATVTETSNTSYSVTADSANGFSFTDGTDNLSYTLYYDGSPVASSGDTVATGSSASGVSRPVSVTFPAAPTNATTGTYTDTVTFTISAP